MSGLHTSRYLEQVLTELPKARSWDPVDYARFLPWPDDVPAGCCLAPG